MTYYEELGITASATDDEIHRAHRRLTKLLHPDQQTDEGMKQLAETQMRRLNSVVEILINPESRRQYDERQTVAGPGSIHYSKEKTPIAPLRKPVLVSKREVEWRRIWRALPWWVWSTIGAFLLTFGAVWFWADDLGSSFGGKSSAYIPPIEDKTTTSVRPDSITHSPAATRPHGALTALSNRIMAAMQRTKAEAAQPQATESKEVKKVVVDAEVGSGGPQAHPVLPSQPPLVSLPSPPSIPVPGPERLDVSHVFSAALHPVAPGPAPLLPSAIAASNEHALNPLVGAWFYSQRNTERVKSGVYQPEFIELKLFAAKGLLRGEYKARYRVDDNKYSPDVYFNLVAADATAKKFNWEGQNGSRGILRISPLDPGVIKVEWKTTVRSRQPALTVGFATLVRRSD